MAICDHGCETASACSGACQPAPPLRTGKRCRWCDEGCGLIGDEHWIVTSIVPARMTIRKCNAVVAA